MPRPTLHALLARAIASIERRLGLHDWDFTHAIDPLGPLPLDGQDDVERAARLIWRAQHVLIFAGSGMSAEAGIATFRGKMGLYDQEDIARATQAATFTTAPDWQLAWHQRWLEHIAQARPHAGYHALTALMRRGGQWTVATQNVDRLMEHAVACAGVTPQIVHLHGVLDEARCHTCHFHMTQGIIDLTRLPACPRCGGRMRPAVVWFGEALPPDALHTAQQAAERADLCLLIGTSGLVYPASDLPELARRHGARLVEINPEPTALSDLCHVILRDGAEHALTTLATRVEALGKLG
jgi:NAD-dependent deacetylase